MKKSTVLLLLVGLLTIISSCSPKVSVRKLNAFTTVQPTLRSEDQLTMDIDPNPIEYTIDISTEAGRLKLNDLSIDEACDLALIEAIRANKCATIFQPQYTHLVEKGKVLRVTLYGFPARYKKKE